MDVMDFSKIGFTIKGPYRSSDGSFQFELVMLQQSQVIGAMPTIVGMVSVRVDNDKCCAALGHALQQVAAQLPPELSS